MLIPTNNNSEAIAWDDVLTLNPPTERDLSGKLSVIIEAHQTTAPAPNAIKLTNHKGDHHPSDVATGPGLRLALWSRQFAGHFASTQV